MRGQWLGAYEGNTNGRIMINIDEVDDHFEGVAYLHPSQSGVPASIAYFLTENKRKKHTVEVATYPIDPRTGFQTTWEEVKELFPEFSHSETAKVTFVFNSQSLNLAAITDNNVHVRATLNKFASNSKTKIEGIKMSWREFKDYVATLSKSEYLYRGQQQQWPLCTSFHRRGRYRISEFTSKDVRQLHQRLSSITTHFFDLNVPDQNGAFFNLLQHHGYPTPLLDWSHSPYVASFFAFRDRPIGRNGKGYVRIYLFNNREWKKRYRQIQNIDPAFPHLSVMEFNSMGNSRMIPQQAVTTVTNLHDIEQYLILKEQESGVKFLTAIDIPANERETAMDDLRFMGITAGSMFPGIDGVCEELRERNFDM